MGVIHVDVTLTNPADRSRSWTGPMLVDTGATDSVVPRPILGAIGVVPESTRTYELADGAEVEMDIATARIEFMGELTAGLVVFGGADVEPLLGVTALESVGVQVDPRNQRLTKLSAVRLKAVTEKPDRLEAYRRILMLLAGLEPIRFPVSSSEVRQLASEHGYKDIASLREDFVSLYCQHLGEKGYVEIGNVQHYLSKAPNFCTRFSNQQTNNRRRNVMSNKQEAERKPGRLCLLAALALAACVALPSASTAQRVPRGNCQAVDRATTVEDDPYREERVVQAPVVGHPKSYIFFLIRVTNPTDDATVLVVATDLGDSRPSYSATAYAKGGIELNVLNSDVDYRSSLGYTATAQIDITDEIAEHAIQGGGLDMQVSFGPRNVQLFVPAEYFLGFSRKANTGWGRCAATATCPWCWSPDR